KPWIMAKLNDAMLNGWLSLDPGDPRPAALCQRVSIEGRDGVEGPHFSTTVWAHLHVVLLGHLVNLDQFCEAATPADLRLDHCMLAALQPHRKRRGDILVLPTGNRHRTLPAQPLIACQIVNG